MPEPADLPPALGVRDAAADLLLGGRCVGCDRPGRVLCGPCREACVPTWPGTAVLDLPDVVSAGVYEGALREAVNGHKERRLVALRPVLGALLATAVARAVTDRGARGPVVLVPVPSRRGSARSRGHDPLGALTADAGRRLGVPVATLLRSRPGVVDQAGLGAAARAANLHGSMAVRPERLRALARDVGAAHVVVCDDVVTTGSTLREAARALAASGVPVLASATIAATPRRA